MDIQAALRDGYQPEEIAAEIGKRTGMDTLSALRDGYSLDEIQVEADRRQKKDVKQSAWDKLKAAAEKSYGTLKAVNKEGWALPIEGATGIANAGIHAAKGLLGAAHVPVQMLKGASFDEAINDSARLINDTSSDIQSPVKSRILAGLGEKVIAPAVNKVADVTGADPETVARVAQGAGDIAALWGMKAPLTSAATSMKGAQGKLMSPKAALELQFKKAAGNKLLASQVESGPVAAQAAANLAETEGLQQAIPGWKVGLGQATEDPRMLTLQRGINMSGDDLAKVGFAEQQMANNESLAGYLDQKMPQGSIEDFLAALERERATRQGASGTAGNTFAGTLDAIQGSGQEMAGLDLRSGAQNVRASLKRQADGLYSQVPRDMPLDSTPLYRKLQGLGDSVDPAFADPKNMPSGMMGRAQEALAPNAPAGPYNTIQEYVAAQNAKASAPNKMTYEQLMQYNEQVTKALRQAKAMGDFAKAANLAEIKSGIEQTLSGAAETGQGAGVDALRTANKFYRDTYVPTVRQGATSNVLKTTGTGGYAVDNALVGSQYFKPGAKGVEAANSFVRTFGDNPEAVQALKGHIGQDLLVATRNLNMHQTESGAISGWLGKHKEALDRLGLSNDFRDVQTAAQALEEARIAEHSFNKSKFGKVLDQTDPDKAMDVLFGGASAKDSINTVLNVKKVIAGDQAAQDGFKRAFSDMLMRKTRLKANDDMAGIANASVAQGRKLFQELEPAMKLIYSQEELDALKNVQRAVEIENRINKKTTGLQGDAQTAGFVQQAHTAVKAAAPWSMTSRLIRFGLDVAMKGRNNSINGYLARAMYDPMLAKELMATAKMGKTQMEATFMKNVSKAAMAGLIPATLRDTNSQQEE